MCVLIDRGRFAMCVCMLTWAGLLYVCVCVDLGRVYIC
jgi:hypothetical protein